MENPVSWTSTEINTEEVGVAPGEADQVIDHPTTSPAAPEPRADRVGGLIEAPVRR